MTTYEILRVVGIFVGPLVLGLFTWVIWATRRLMAVDSQHSHLDENAREQFDRINKLEEKVTRLEARTRGMATK